MASAWACVRSRASICRRRARGQISSAASKNDFPQSMRIVLELERVMRADVLRRRFLRVEAWRALGHTRQEDLGSVRQPIAGTCEEVPVPRNTREDMVGERFGEGMGVESAAVVGGDELDEFIFIAYIAPTRSSFVDNGSSSRGSVPVCGFMFFLCYSQSEEPSKIEIVTSRKAELSPTSYMRLP
jgi:hypothetical protein